jgi:hypothetical protein
VSFVAWHRPLRDRPRRYLLVSVGTIFRTDNRSPNPMLLPHEQSIYKDLKPRTIMDPMLLPHELSHT